MHVKVILCLRFNASFKKLFPTFYTQSMLFLSFLSFISIVIVHNFRLSIGFLQMHSTKMHKCLLKLIWSTSIRDVYTVWIFMYCMTSLLLDYCVLCLSTSSPFHALVVIYILNWRLVPFLYPFYSVFFTYFSPNKFLDFISWLSVSNTTFSHDFQ